MANKSKPKSSKSSKKVKFKRSVPRYVWVALIFGLIGVFYLLYQTFAATTTVKYTGTLTAQDPTANYQVTTGSGTLSVEFSDRSADLVLDVVNNTTGAVLGTIDKVGKQKKTLDVEVTSGTYDIKVRSSVNIKRKLNYNIWVTYPLEEVVSTPTAVILSPLGSESVSGIVDFTADARDEQGVTKVEFYVNGEQVGVDSSAPYGVKWDTTSVVNGAHTLNVKSYNLAGGMGSASGTVTVANEAPVASSRFPGDPNPRVSGKTYWGAGIGGNASPARHEDPTGVSLPIRRTFYQWKHAADLNSYMYSTVRDDLASNRLPFISIKTPGWQAIADGNYDAELDAMFNKLASYGGPVWFVIHHEPEGGGGSNTPDDPGGAPAWRAMQTKIRQRIDATGTGDKIAFMPVLMSWTFDSRSGRNPADWWVPGIWDAYIVDHYADSESLTDVQTTAWKNFVAWIETKNMPYGIAEWGNRGSDTQAASEMQAFWEWSFANKKDMIAYTYFDSGLNSPNGSWELIGESLDTFRNIMKNDSRVQRINDL